MELLVNKLVSGIVQVLLFSIIPLLWWFISVRKKESFFCWIGIKKFEADKNLFKVFLVVLFTFLGLSIGIMFMVRGVDTATSEFSGLGILALPVAIVYSFLNTALSEEILFRGFLLKRISNRFGFSVGNALQALLFGLLHGVMFFQIVGMVEAVVIIIFTGLIGWFMGYINEKKADGSILPSWGLHAFANLCASLVAMFSII